MTICNELQKMNYESKGNEILYDGKSGKQIETSIFIDRYTISVLSTWSISSTVVASTYGKFDPSARRRQESMVVLGSENGEGLHYEKPSFHLIERSIRSKIAETKFPYCRMMRMRTQSTQIHKPTLCQRVLTLHEVRFEDGRTDVLQTTISSILVMVSGLK